ncbi:Uncharacterised protein [Vibrio cholerae]|uniref:Uncharacterized protein n=1 Tax=Vibrio cholerae TaxID=666 RepID=A0A655Z155_VIBCL|nr:Uncharacterised protein [Vibrio cholerae]CSC57150.1 Uncharacterised protein [Vibrio cholerae]
MPNQQWNIGISWCFSTSDFPSSFAGKSAEESARQASIKLTH